MQHNFPLISLFEWQKILLTSFQNPPAFNSWRRLQHFWDPSFFLNPASMQKLIQGVFSISCYSLKEFFRCISRSCFSVQVATFVGSLGHPLLDWRSVGERWGLILEGEEEQSFERLNKVQGSPEAVLNPRTHLTSISVIVTCLYKSPGDGSILHSWKLLSWPNHLHVSKGEDWVCESEKLPK